MAIRKDVIFKIISERDQDDMGVLIDDIIVETVQEEDCQLEREESQAIINVLEGEHKTNNLASIYLDTSGNIACTLDNMLIYLLQSSNDKEALKELFINSFKETLDIL